MKGFYSGKASNRHLRPSTYTRHRCKFIPLNGFELKPGDMVVFRNPFTKVAYSYPYIGRVKWSLNVHINDENYACVLPCKYIDLAATIQALC